jgi:hypothetical protein
MVPQYLHVLRQVGAQPPFFVFVTLVRTAGIRFATRNKYFGWGHSEVVRREVLEPPGVVIQNVDDVDLPKLLKPIFDSFWHAVEQAASPPRRKAGDLRAVTNTRRAR